MTEIDPKPGVQALRNSLDQLKTLLAWRALKRAEARPGCPLSWLGAETLQIELRNEYSFFLFTAVHLHAGLDSGAAGLSGARHKQIKSDLAALEHQVHRLNLPALLNP